MVKSTSQSFQGSVESLISPEIATRIDDELQHWYKDNGRVLNFRQTTDPYAIMVSEFMLQQTTVTVVQPYFERFLTQYPNVQKLAEATEESILAAWAGLGYYRRARQLHAAAKAIVETFNGIFPTDAMTLKELPGFGRYTAGAVSSLAFDQPAPILEANTVRVFARLAGIDGVTGQTSFMNKLWDVSSYLVAESPSPRKFNNAAMELGALVCRPHPLCEDCPISDYCRALKSGTASKIPTVAPRRKSIPVHTIGFVIIDHEGSYGVRKIAAGEWHAGMWQFPEFRLENEILDPDDVAKKVENLLGFSVLKVKYMMTLKYTVTHHRVVSHVFYCYKEEAVANSTSEKMTIDFLTLPELSELPMGSAQSKLRQAIIDTKANN